jgi:hypothetical protein
VRVRERKRKRELVPVKALSKSLHSTAKAASSTVLTLDKSIFLANAKEAAFLTRPKS